MVTEHTRLTIVTDTGPCAAQGARHTWPPGQSTNRGGTPRPTPGGLVRDTHANPPKCRFRVGRGGSWKQRHCTRRTVCVSVRCTRDNDGMLCSFFFLVLIVIFVSFSAYHRQTDTALGGLLRTLEARVHRPLDHPPVTVHPPRGNRQGDPARRVQATLCQRTSYIVVDPLQNTSTRLPSRSVPVFEPVHREFDVSIDEASVAHASMQISLRDLTRSQGELVRSSLENSNPTTVRRRIVGKRTVIPLNLCLYPITWTREVCLIAFQNLECQRLWSPLKVIKRNVVWNLWTNRWIGSREKGHP